LSRFYLQGFVRHQLGPRLDQQSTQVVLTLDRVVQQFNNLLPYLLTRWYPSSSHGVWSFLPFRAGDLVFTAGYHTPPFFAGVHFTLPVYITLAIVLRPFYRLKSFRKI